MRKATIASAIRSSFARPAAPRLTVALMAAALFGCGDDSLDPVVSTESPAPQEAPSTQAPSTPGAPLVEFSLIGGPVRNAVVCLDKDGNGACGADEPSAKTDESGVAKLDIAAADVGKHPTVAVVGTDAVDATLGPVDVQYVLSAPAARSTRISPLTTLVNRHMQTTGAGVDDAENYIKAVAGLKVSPFDDYARTAATSADSAAAAVLAQLIVMTMQRHVAIIAPVVGQPDSTGATIKPEDLYERVTKSQVNNLSHLRALAADPALNGASDPAAARRQAVASVVALAIAPQPAIFAQVAGFDRLVARAVADAASAAPATPADMASTRMFKFTDARNWTYHSFVSTLADTTPDASGTIRFYDVRARNTAGTLALWGFGNAATNKDDLAWNGSSWGACPLGTRSTQVRRDPAGVSKAANYCNGFAQTVSSEARVDIAGQAMASVVARIRALPGGDMNLAYSEFGPVDMSLLGTATFPAGSQLRYQTVIDTALHPPAYSPTASAMVMQATAAVAAGGDARTGSSACGQILPTTPVSSFMGPAATLEGLIEANKGTPCVYQTWSDSSGNSSGARTDWWDASTLGMGSVAGAATQPAGTGSFYTTTASVRVAFTGPGSSVTYYKCLTRPVVFSSYNCDAIGKGTYAIATMGDARVMTFADLPLMAAYVGYDRVFVERGGKVYYGSVARTGLFRYVGLNLEATNAMFGVLGVPALVPN